MRCRAWGIVWGIRRGVRGVGYGCEVWGVGYGVWVWGIGRGVRGMGYVWIVLVKV